MKILLTGHPKMGKTTVLEKFKETYGGKMRSILTKAIKDAEGNRLGFEVINSQGEKQLLTHKTDITSTAKVGEYFVDIAMIDTFIVKEMSQGLNELNSLLVLDEIGRMQSLSPLFLQTTRDVIHSFIPLLGTIVYDEEPWSMEFKQNPTVILVEVTKTNRDILPNELLTIFNNVSLLNALSSSQLEKITIFLRNYLQTNQAIQINKLFHNTIPYLIEKRIKIMKESSTEIHYAIKGNTNTHIVKKNLTTHSWLCDCDLFLGRNIYAGKPGECSHIQAAQLFTT